jgi:hypothetical protein
MKTKLLLFFLVLTFSSNAQLVTFGQVSVSQITATTATVSVSNIFTSSEPLIQYQVAPQNINLDIVAPVNIGFMNGLSVNLVGLLPNTNWHFRFKGTNSAGISYSQTINFATTASLSAEDFSQNNLEVALYPNPVNDVLNIESELELKSVEIYSIQGQKVLTTNQKKINVSDLAAGMYMVRIQDLDNNIATKKIIIK